MNIKDFLNWAQGAQNNMSPECWDSTTDKEKENIEEIRSLFKGVKRVGVARVVKSLGGKFGRTAIGGGMRQGAYGPEGKPGAAGTERQGGLLKTVGHTFRTAYGDKSPSLQDRVRASRAYSGAGTDSAVAGDKAVAVSDDDKALRGERFRRKRDVAIEKMKRKMGGKPLTGGQRAAMSLDPQWSRRSHQQAGLLKGKQRKDAIAAEVAGLLKGKQRKDARQQAKQTLRRAFADVAIKIPKDARGRIRSDPKRKDMAAEIIGNIAKSRLARNAGKDLRSGRTTNSRGRDLTSGSTRT